MRNILNSDADNVWTADQAVEGMLFTLPWREWQKYAENPMDRHVVTTGGIGDFEIRHVEFEQNYKANVTAGYEVALLFRITTPDNQHGILRKVGGQDPMGNIRWDGPYGWVDPVQRTVTVFE
jgi:hypothetical protein